ncbi:TolC family protein [Lacibacter sediminis]|uniref:TolC family protein n=1 Tax=Lacibacter sediminis TaxID=2760713 RepID=A0A7G5XKD5_9BACT|nr:TolC family protein [Lacibacter sediminis]QNA45938.1 TolC family protein [Lacibacter sediminis]
MKNYLIKAVVLLLSVASTQITQAQSTEMSLKDVLQVVSVGNRQLQIRALELKRADELVKEAKSYLLPSVQFNSSYLVFAERPVIYLRDETATPKANDIKYGGRLAFDANVTAVYAITNPVAKSELKSAVLQKQMDVQSKRAYEEQLAMEVSQLYYTVLFYEKQKKVLMQSLWRNEQALTDAKNLFLQGKNLKTDTLSHFISVQNIRLAISSLDNQVQIAFLQLKQLMGIESTMDISLSDTLSVEADAAAFEIAASLVDIARQNRTDISMSKLGIEQRKIQLQKTKAMYKPQLLTFAQYQVQSQADDFGFRYYGLPRTSFAGLRLSIPLYSGNRLKYQSTAVSVSVKQQELALADLDTKVQTKLTALSLRLQDEKSQWAIQKQNVEAALINYKMSNERYRSGLSNRLELNDAELALTKAKLEESRLQYSIQLLFVDLKKEMGVLKLINE